MKISRDQLSAVTVRHVEPGSIRVGEQTLTTNVMLTADEAVERWDAGTDVAALTEKHFDAVLAAGPEIIVLGTGWGSAFPPQRLVFAMARRGVGFEAMDTSAACRTFNILVNEGRRVAAALIVEQAGG